MKRLTFWFSAASLIYSFAALAISTFNLKQSIIESQNNHDAIDAVRFDNEFMIRLHASDLRRQLVTERLVIVDKQRNPVVHLGRENREGGGFIEVRNPLKTRVVLIGCDYQNGGVIDVANLDGDVVGSLNGRPAPMD